MRMFTDDDFLSSETTIIKKWDPSNLQWRLYFTQHMRWPWGFNSLREMIKCLQSWIIKWWHTHTWIYYMLYIIYDNIYINVYTWYTWYTCTYAHTCTYIHIYIYIPTLGGYTPYVSPRLRRELAQVPNSTLERLLAGGDNRGLGKPSGHQILPSGYLTICTIIIYIYCILLWEIPSGKLT